MILLIGHEMKNTEIIIHNIIKIKDLYFIWDEDKKRPLTHGLKKYELIDWVKTNEGEYGSYLLDKRFNKLEEKGISLPDNNIIDIDIFLSNNKASSQKKFLSKEEIYDMYNYKYVDDFLKHENDLNQNEYLQQLPKEIVMSNSFYLFSIFSAFLLIILYSYMDSKLLQNIFFLKYIDKEHLREVICSLLGILFGIIISPKIYLWNYKNK